MRTFLFQIEPLDGPSFVLAPLILGSVAFVAAVGPAVRAGLVDPMSTLRHE